jgi:hypothetical protein
MTTATEKTQTVPAEVTVPSAMVIELAAAVCGAGDALEFLDGNNSDLAEFFARFAQDVIVDVFGWDPTIDDDKAYDSFPVRVAIETRADEIEADALDLTETRGSGPPTCACTHAGGGRRGRSTSCSPASEASRAATKQWGGASAAPEPHPT